MRTTIHPGNNTSLGLHDGDVGIAGVNLGFGFCKLVVDGVPDIFMSALTSLNQGVDGLQTRRPNPLNVVRDADGKTFEAGVDGVLNTTDEPLKVLSRDWGRSKHYRLLMGAVLNRLAAAGKKRWIIATGLAADHYKDAAYRQEISDLWSGAAGHHDTEHGSIEVIMVRVLPETAGGFFELMSSRDNNTLIRASSGAVLDFGRMTINWLPFKGDQTDANRLGSVDVGMSNVIAEATKLIRLEARNPNLHPLDVEAAMLGLRPLHKLTVGVGGRPVPTPLSLDIPITKAVAEVWPRIEQALSNNLGDLRGKLLIAIGGGAQTFGDLLQSTYKGATVLMVPDAQMSNAWGLYRMARVSANRRTEAAV